MPQDIQEVELVDDFLAGQEQLKELPQLVVGEFEVSGLEGLFELAAGSDFGFED